MSDQLSLDERTFKFNNGYEGQRHWIDQILMQEEEYGKGNYDYLVMEKDGKTFLIMELKQKAPYSAPFFEINYACRIDVDDLTRRGVGSMWDTDNFKDRIMRENALKRVKKLYSDEIRLLTELEDNCSMKALTEESYMEKERQREFGSGTAYIPEVIDDEYLLKVQSDTINSIALETELIQEKREIDSNESLEEVKRDLKDLCVRKKNDYTKKFKEIEGSIDFVSGVGGHDIFGKIPVTILPGLEPKSDEEYRDLVRNYGQEKADDMRNGTPDQLIVYSLKNVSTERLFFCSEEISELKLGFIKEKRTKIPKEMLPDDETLKRENNKIKSPIVITKRVSDQEEAIIKYSAESRLPDLLAKNLSEEGWRRWTRCEQIDDLLKSKFSIDRIRAGITEEEFKDLLKILEYYSRLLEEMEKISDNTKNNMSGSVDISFSNDVTLKILTRDEFIEQGLVQFQDFESKYYSDSFMGFVYNFFNTMFDDFTEPDKKIYSEDEFVKELCAKNLSEVSDLPLFISFLRAIYNREELTQEMRDMLGTLVRPLSYRGGGGKKRKSKKKYNKKRKSKKRKISKKRKKSKKHKKSKRKRY